MASKPTKAGNSRKAAFEARKAVKDERHAIAALAQRYLDRHQPRTYRINVDRDAVVKRGDTWLVVAEAEKIDAGYEFYNSLAEASMEFEDKERVNLLLVPVIPPEDD